MNLKKSLLAVIAGVVLNCVAAESPWFEMNGDLMAKKLPQLTKVLPDSKTRVIVCNGKTTCFQSSKSVKLEDQYPFLFWFYPEKQNGNAVLLCKPGWHNMITVNQKNLFGTSFYSESKKINYLGFNKPLASEQWYLGAVVLNNNTVTLYLNGKAVAVRNLKEKMFSVNSYFFFASPLPKAPETEHFNGMLNGIRIWTSALNADEIMKIYQDEQAQYPMD